MLKKIIPLIVLLLGAWLGQDWLGGGQVPGFAPATAESSPADSYRSGAQVLGTGEVQRVLADDNDGSRHQRFILKLDSGQTVLIAHNIDLAPRVDGLQRGDTVQFYGQFEENDRGGVIHWTHHDPQGQHVGGWLQHKGRRYE
ncbi:MAG: DUF3465 domain-containing protein, partial [Woeseia sp.]